MIDLPPDMQERVVCSITAAVKYEMPANILLAIAEKEGGKPGQWVRNRNGTYDIGPLQLIRPISKTYPNMALRPVLVASRGCYPFELAAWRVRQHIKNDRGDI